MKAYWVGTYNMGGFWYVLRSRKDALSKRSAVAGEIGEEFIDIRVSTLKEVDIKGLPEGRIHTSQHSELDLAKRGFPFSEYGPYDACPGCGKQTELIELSDDTWRCSEDCSVRSGSDD